ncbi:alpha-glucuronidase family glycosyl hydrolase [Marinimicrobium sp. ABcell2]|uniref:alpha-glucuronidase family glycosyl hydrolase n=1 Tax=Marinimicrobium sp. ABcell2 TaxID=3069751 RepID=UPI0027B7A843|nr:alpha-glucuronidase family glycosyl hydrolase [Marinimicrobium sp. ABcell2]MDQ2076302.1 alpha-glucuronidase family glycosyl hydrolase [Marinimicrobium sp. ABcell2]
MSRFFAFLLTFALISGSGLALAEDGYRMWLRYDPIENTSLRNDYRSQLRHLVVDSQSPTIDAAVKELRMGLGGLLDRELAERDNLARRGNLVIGTPESSELIASLDLEDRLAQVGPEGFILEETRINRRPATIVAAQSDVGVLYGVYHLLRLLQTGETIDGLNVSSAPKVQHRMVNHWDNLDRLVERGYAGLSLWDWGSLPNHRDPRYTDYARMNASLGINATVINNVNADPRILSDQFLEKVAVLADTFRPYGIKMYLSINFDSPRAFGDLDTADPLDPGVRQWWKDRAEKVYEYIPDFGGFLVKADSEGQPGPHGYGRTHADGANMLAEALEPFGGLVFWRAFVYDPEQEDRFREAYDEFMPLDGKFKDSVILQIKNGPIDFQPREPFSPLFGGLKDTNIMLELQVTQEYFGFSYHLAYQGPLFEEVLQADTYAKGEGSTVGRILGNEVFEYKHTGMAGVINPGTDRNWTGHPFVQSSWYVYGRMAWDYELTSEQIADEWMRMTFSHDRRFLDPVGEIMEISREAGVNYRNPLGLTHLYAQGHHYGPAPWYAEADRLDWTAAYYHRASETGIGFDRTETGSNAVEQYHEPVRELFADLDRVPEDFMLWFHHVDWDHEMESGRTLWEELVHKYYKGVEQVEAMQRKWDQVEGLIDQQRFEHVKALLEIQLRDAIRWRDSCVLYFSSVSGRPIPEQYPQPEHDLEHYKKLERTFYVPDPWHPASRSRALN